MTNLIESLLADPLLLGITGSTLFLLALSIAFGFLAIKYRRLNDRMSARWKRLEALWEPLVVAVLAGDAPPETVWQHVEPPDRLFFIDLLTRYSKRLRGEANQRLTALSEPFLESVLRNLRQGAPAQRARAVQSLGMLAFERHADEIVKALDDESPLVAMIAARTLARAEHPQFVGPIINRLYRFENWSPKFLASMLATVGPAAAPALRAAYADPANPPRSRAVAAEALRWLQDLASAEIAARVLATERGSESAITTGSPDEAASETAGPPSTPRPELEEDAETHFQDPHRDLIASSLRLLRNMGRAEHADEARAFRHAKDFVIRSYAFRALGRLGDASDLPDLMAALGDPSKWVALHAARALKELHAGEQLEAVAAARHPRADVVRQVLAEAA